MIAEALVCIGAFVAAAEAVYDPRDREVIGWLEEVIKTLQARGAEVATVQAGAFFSPGEACRQQILALLESATTSADICVFTITCDKIARVIRDAARKGVRVRIVTDDDKAMDRGSDVSRLEDAGIPVRVDRTRHHMHHKFAVIDRKTVLTGSYNWTRSAATSNQENVVILEDANLARSFSDEFQKLWDQFG